MAAVYRAYQTSVDREVAIKVILKSIALDEHMVQRFQREARLVARLEHPHILPIYDFDGGHEPPYIVMRFLDDGTLKQFMKQGPLALDEIAYLFRQVGTALDYAHLYENSTQNKKYLLHKAGVQSRPISTHLPIVADQLIGI